MGKRELPLFNWQPPVQVLPFPASARIGHARRVADVYVRQNTEKGRNHYWNRIVASFRKQIADAGIPDDVIEEQVEAYRVAVQRQLDQMCADECLPDDGAA